MILGFYVQRSADTKLRPRKNTLYHIPCHMFLFSGRRDVKTQKPRLKELSYRLENRASRHLPLM